MTVLQPPPFIKEVHWLCRNVITQYLTVLQKSLLALHLMIMIVSEVTNLEEYVIIILIIDI